ncbi:6-bladed beta-propeller protein [Mucilaginibacter mallensis]|uniref:6-bladed beta-propeller protein n=1 Tax=Mucilaginibacter mallensis TaxID=652787 RepID=A0A1H2B1K4_MUCMA|nr:6-bladed beta-propeller [Mucilaginibacter mallensis]SDT52155.1 6-bladed beta-propeller protein [Mucilaginibacter mallensis]
MTIRSNPVLKPLVFFLMSFLIFSCNHSDELKAKKLKNAEKFFGYQDQTSQVKNLVVNKKHPHVVDLITYQKDSINISTLVDSISYTPLETNDNCLIGDIDKMFYDGRRIIILDKRKAQSVFIFEKTGKFHAKINFLGKGPGKYAGIEDVAVDYRTGNIILLDLSDNKIITYDQDSHFLSEKPVGFYVYELALFPKSSDILLASHSEFNAHFNSVYLYNLLLTDSLVKPYARAFKFNEESGLNFHWWNPINIHSDGSALFYYPRFTDTIYRIEKNSATAEYKIDYGKSSLPPDFFESQTDNRFEQLQGSGRFSFFMGDFVASPDFFFCIASIKGLDTYGFYCIKSGKTKSSTVISLDRPDVPFFNVPKCNYKNEFVSAVSVKGAATEMISTIHDIGKKDKKILGRFSHLRENDNPILLFYTLKNF